MKIAIVGGGAAGLMAAAAVVESAPGAEVWLLEKNDGLGKKVLISGGGRCNVTTGLRDVREALRRYPRGGKFLSSALYRFPPEAVFAWFEARGVPLKIEEDLRVFPVSDDGHDVVAVFERLFAASDVHVWLKANAVSLERTESGFSLRIKDAAAPLLVDRVVLTTGGQAYRHTGSTGDGYAFAQSLGHALTPLAPSLNAFFTQEAWPRELAGLSFERATVRVPRAGAPAAAYTGPFLFTHKGITGPAVFAVSSLVAFEAYDAARPLPIEIDVFPDVSADALLAEWQAALAAFPRKSLENVLALLVPKSFAAVACRALGISGETHAAEVSKADRGRLVRWLKAVPLSAVGRGAGDEFVTAGGVVLAEVDPTTMESRLCPGLFFAGEILDVDGYTGGFNLQAAWATGRLAGLAACGGD